MSVRDDEIEVFNCLDAASAALLVGDELKAEKALDRASDLLLGRSEGWWPEFREEALDSVRSMREDYCIGGAS